MFGLAKNEVKKSFPPGFPYAPGDLRHGPAAQHLAQRLRRLPPLLRHPLAAPGRAAARGDDGALEGAGAKAQATARSD